jgi:uncharacterized protein (TIGR02246 family)
MCDARCAMRDLEEDEMRLAAMVGVMVLTATATAASAQSKAGADEAAIAKIRAAYQTAAGTQDGAAIAKLYAPDGVAMHPNTPAIKGRAAIEAFHKAFGQQWMMHGITITPTETKVVGDTAYDIGIYKQQLMAQKGGGIVDDKGKYVVLLKKDASGNWWVTHSISNSDVPPPAPAAKK